jgi:hypothetical protein
VVTSLFKSRQTSREVKLKLVEFLYFYLGAERVESERGESVSLSGVLGGRGEEVMGAFRKESGDVRRTVGGPVGGGVGMGVGEEALLKSPEEKQAMLARYLSNVQDLVDDMREASAGGVGSGGGLLSMAGNISPVRAGADE